jgi:hypothetical protein
LLHAENLELAVPGTYRSGNPVIPIAKFGPKLSVIASKQRPRRLSVIGGDGKEYQYCLKGHEDLRQDERVMQVFGLVNTLLAASEESFMRQLHIQALLSSLLLRTLVSYNGYSIAIHFMFSSKNIATLGKSISRSSTALCFRLASDINPCASN